MNETDENALSLGEIWRAVRKYLAAVIAVPLALTAAVVLVFALAINPSAVSYAISFRLNFPSGAAAQYADGSAFDCYDLVSYDFLNEAKSGGALSAADLGAMLASDGISVSSDSSDGTEWITVSVKGSYFSDRASAEAFLCALAETAAEHIAESASAVDYAVGVAVFSAASLEDRLALLSEWKTAMLECYDGWIGAYSASYAVEGQTLADYRAALNNAYGTGTENALRAELELSGYDRLELNGYASLAEAVAACRSALEGEYALNAQIIAALQNALGGVSAYACTLAAAKTGESGTAALDAGDLSATLAYYIGRNELIAYQLGTALTEENVSAFVVRLTAQYGALKAEAETLGAVTAAIYGQNTSVTYAARTARAQGETGLFTVGCIALLGSLLLVVFFVCAAEIPRSRSAAKRERTEEKEFAQAPLAEAPAADARAVRAEE